MFARTARLQVLVDIALVLVIGGLFEAQIFAGSDSFAGTPVAGPRAVNVLLPLLFAVPLVWRRRWPLATGTIALAGICIQALASGNSPESLQYIALWVLWPYSFAAYAGFRRALIGLAVTLAAFVVYAGTNHDITSGRSSDEWAGAFFLILAISGWLAGATIHAQRERATLRAQAAAIEQQAQEAVDTERTRIARELHDIVAHNLSVVVVQAAGAQALADDESRRSSALAKIEQTGREALVEMRRLLGVLRQGDDVDARAPLPTATDLPTLADQLRSTGMSVDLDLVGEVASLPAAVSQSAYRIVQESLTNSLKHAGRDAQARVRVSCEADACTIEVVDDGAGRVASPLPGDGPGHGLIGMRERADVFGGEVSAGPRTDQPGFIVHVRLPLNGRVPA